MINLIGKVISTNIVLRPIEVSDAQFVLDLRTSSRADALNPISSNIYDQVRYLTDYRSKYLSGDEIYFVVQVRKDLTNIGLVRVHDLGQPGHFNWASFIMSSEVSPIFAFEVALLVYALGFEYRDKIKCGPFPVEKSNERLIQFHNTIGMSEIVSENDRQYHLVTTRERFEHEIKRFRRRRLGLVEELEFVKVPDEGRSSIPGSP